MASGFEKAELLSKQILAAFRMLFGTIETISRRFDLRTIRTLLRLALKLKK